MTYSSNRPERCGALLASLRGILASAESAAEHYAGYPDLMSKAIWELTDAAREAIAQDDTLRAADAEAFERHMAEREHPAIQPHDEGTSYCTSQPEHGHDIAHECGTPAAGALDTSDYPARLFVIQRDPADPESWVFRCGEEHASSVAGLGPSHGWQSPDYATEDDALIAAGDHARAMHDMGLPNALAERVAAAERAAAAGGWAEPPTADQITAAIKARESAE